MPCARHELGRPGARGAGRPSQPLTFLMSWMPRAPLPRGRFAIQLAPAWMLQAWMLQDAPNYRGTERRGYGVGGNAKGPAAQPRRPNKGHIGYGSGENEIELDVLYRALRGERERELQRMRATSHD